MPFLKIIFVFIVTFLVSSTGGYAEETQLRSEPSLTVLASANPLAGLIDSLPTFKQNASE